MAWPIKTVRFSYALIAWVAAAPVIAAGTEFSAEFGLGAEYDSNVSVDELDATSNESDYAYIADADLGLDQQLGEKVDLSLNYNVSQTNYDRFERLDRTTHLVGVPDPGHTRAAPSPARAQLAASRTRRDKQEHCEGD